MRLTVIRWITLWFLCISFHNSLHAYAEERNYNIDYTTQVGIALKLHSATPAGVPGTYDLCYDILVKNFRNYSLNKVQVNLGLIPFIQSISNISVSILDNPAGVVLNSGFDGVSVPEMLDANASILPGPNSSNNYFKLRLCFTAGNIVVNKPYNLNATVFGHGEANHRYQDRSTDGDDPDPNNNLIPDDPGENIPTTFIVYDNSAAEPAADRPVYSSASKVNYVRVWDVRVPEQNSNAIVGKSLAEVRQSTQYTDGLGRSLQHVIKQGAYATGVPATDLVSVNVYGPQGREQWRYLPFGSTQSDGSFKLTPLTDHATFYNNLLSGQQGETNAGPDDLPWAFGAVFYEASPLNRTDNVYRPGVGWMGSHDSPTESGKRNRRIRYLSNTAVDDVKKWIVLDGAEEGDWAISYQTAGAYAPGDLYKTIIYDEGDKQVIEFKDKNGRLILKKVQLMGYEDTGAGQGYGGWLSTYYIYDLSGRLRCIITPQATQELVQNGWSLSSSLVDAGCYSYEYDRRDQLIMKKKPGIVQNEAEYMVYDESGRLVMTQDGKQRQPDVNKWNVILYDQHDRPVIRGLYVSSFSFKQLMQNAGQSANYPFSHTSQPATGWTVLSEVGYDNYDGLPGNAGLDKYFDAAYSTGDYMHTAYNITPLYAQQPVQSFHTRGRVTWTKTAVYGTTVYNYSVNIYDNESRLIQVKATNITGGTDITSIQFNWAGQLLRTVEKHTPDQLHTHIILTDIGYDELGREILLQKKIQSTLAGNNQLPSEWTVIAKTEYDALGRVKRKEIGRQKDPLTGHYTLQPLEYMNYEYDVNNALIGINRKLLELPAQMPAPSADGGYFSLELAYDKPTGAAKTSSYVNPRFDGMISGLMWKTRGDKIDRKYDFTYDPAQRLTKSDFREVHTQSATWNSTKNLSETVAYDANGNLNTLSRQGVINNNSPVIDQLSYFYRSGFDRLAGRPAIIYDNAAGNSAANLGDFQRRNTTANDDYSYNANGSLASDLNKGITGISYYEADELPKQIVTDKGIVTHTYDGAGVKLKTVAVENPSTDNGNRTITTTNTYINGFVYESREIVPADPLRPDYTNKLLYVLHEEGRIRATVMEGGEPSWAYDYFITDHLGSTRMVLTDEVKILYYPAATLEGNYSDPQANSMVNYEKLFYNINTSRITEESSIPSWNIPEAESVTNGRLYYNHNGNPPSNLSYPSGATPAQGDQSNRVYKMTGVKTGLEFVIRVMGGDKVDIFGKSYYVPPVSVTNALPGTLDILTGLLAAPAAPAAAKGFTAQQLANLNAGLIPMSVLRGNSTSGPSPTNTPSASISYIFLDEQLQYAGGGYSSVGNGGEVKDHWQSDAVLQNITVPRNGYLFVYVTNFSNRDVYFDNLQVVHKPGPILEETHYYPFGLKIAGISSRAYSAMKTPYQYQGAFSEFDETTGWNNFALRNYDPQTARWTGADPYDQFPNPYTGMGNNPVNMVDPDGGASYQPPVPTGGWLQGVSGVLSNMASSYLLTTVTQQQTCPECLRIYEFLKYTEAGRQIGTLVSVGKWAENTVKGTWNLYRMSLLTTPAYEKAEAVNQLFNTTKTALDYLSLPDYSRVSVATTYVSTKYNNYIRLNPYEQGVAFGEVAPNLLTTALPVMRLGRLGAATKGGGSLVNLTEETFSQALFKGAENVGGYSVYGTKGLVGNTFNRNIFLLEASGSKSLSGFRSFVGSLEREALGAGANKISIYGSSVINKGFLNPNIARRFGYSFEQSGSGVLLQKTLK